MSDVLTGYRPGAPERRSTLYAERSDTPPGKADRLIAQVIAGCMPATTPGARRYRQRLANIERQGEALAALDEKGLRAKLDELRIALRRQGTVPELVERSFAIIREISFRCIGKRHYPVQLIGGLVMMEGRLAEMQTGEGKTITAGLAAATAAFAGIPTHVITVNDYLAARDAGILQPVYDFCGLSVGVIQHGMKPPERRAAYGCDITYVVNKEIAFDYLRDRLATGERHSHTAATMADFASGGRLRPRLVLRGLNFCIVDEADSILIDEARTPLIISGGMQNGEGVNIYEIAMEAAGRLDPMLDYRIINQESRVVELTAAGSEKLKAEMAELPGMWRARRAREEVVRQALAARHLYHRDKDYVVRDDKVHIVDEHTGRIAEGRAWQNGLHQFIEIKEDCPLSDQRVTQASITYQQFFRRYLHLSGMSGTLSEVARELRVVYGLKTVRIPPHRPNRRGNSGTFLCRTREQKWQRAVEAAAGQIADGRPVLIGTKSVRASEELSARLEAAGLPHIVLNAHHDKQEAEIVAAAGEAGRLTVATNMAGRGTDINLGANVAQRGGLHVILTELHESRRIDRQLIGRGGRQGDPSTYQTILSIEDDLWNDFAPAPAKLLAGAVIPQTGHSEALLSRWFMRFAQRRAEYVLRRLRAETEQRQLQMDRTLGFVGSVS